MQSSNFSKPAVRAAMKRELASLSSEERQRRSDLLCERILTSSHWVPARVVMVFSPLPDEPDIRRIHQPDSAKRFVYPRVEGQTLVLHEVNDPTEFVRGRWGILEPADDPATVVSAANVDLAIIPGFAFSRRMERLGRGAGFYDRFLPQLRTDAVKLGVCLDLQIVDALPSESHDVLMNRVVTA